MQKLWQICSEARKTDQKAAIKLTLSSGTDTDNSFQNLLRQSWEKGRHMAWHDRTVDEILRELNTDAKAGLSSEEARRRLLAFGPNRIRQERQISPFRILAAQFNDFLIYLLLVAAVLSVAVGFLPGNEADYAEAILILSIVVANGIFGFVQDYHAETAMQALRDLSTPETFVVRDGVRVAVPSTEVVPGDIVLLEQGMRIPADARLFQSFSLETMESALTGESGGVSKMADPAPGDAPLAERASMVFMNTDAVQAQTLLFTRNYSAGGI